MAYTRKCPVKGEPYEIDSGVPVWFSMGRGLDVSPEAVAEVEPEELIKKVVRYVLETGNISREEIPSQTALRARNKHLFTQHYGDRLECLGRGTFVDVFRDTKTGKLISI